MPKMTVAQKREFLVEMCNCREYLKTDVELNKAVLKKHLKFLPQQKLYKFRACIEREFRMLEENCIWMSLASSFPDPFDHTINIDLVKNRREVKEWLGKNGSSLCFEVVKRLFEEKGLAIPYTFSDFEDYMKTCLDENGIPIKDRERAFLAAHATPDELSQMNSIIQQLVCARKRFASIEEQMTKMLFEIIDQVRRETREKSLIYCYLLDTLFDDPATLEKVRIAYEDGRLLSDIVLYDIACRYGSDAQYIACSKSVYSKGKKSFPPREPRVNYEELRAASDASYFAMLFDKKAAKQMLEDLTRYAGNPNVTVEELWENKISAEIHWSSPLMYLQYSIYNYVENKNSLVINFLQCVQWESFVLQEAQHMLSNTKNLKVFAWQRDTLIDIAQKTVEGSDILDAVKYDNDSVEVCPDVAAAIYLISYFEYPINIDSMKELVSFPEYVFCGENNGEKYEYLSKYVPVGDILAKIEMDLKSGTVCRSTVRDHIEYCEKKKYRGIKDIAVMLCTDESQDELLQNYALRYLYEVFGSDCVRNEVVPFASEQLLLQIYHVCRDVPKEPLCKVMQDKFAESKSFELMAPLIILGSELALKEYLLYAKENHRIPERVDSFDGPTEAISKISDPQKIGILAELLQIAMEPSFRDGDFFTLRSGVTNALVNCGKEKPEAVIAVFERQIALEKQEINIRCCNDAIERIGQLTRGKFRQPMSLRDVKTVLQRMIS